LNDFVLRVKFDVGWRWELPVSMCIYVLPMDVEEDSITRSKCDICIRSIKSFASFLIAWR